MCSVFWLFWLSYQYLPSDWLDRLLRGSLTVARGSSPESPGRRVLMILLVYCIFFIVLLCVCVVSRPYVIYFPTARLYPIFAESAVKHQASKQTISTNAITTSTRRLAIANRSRVSSRTTKAFGHGCGVVDREKFSRHLV